MAGTHRPAAVSRARPPARSRARVLDLLRRSPQGLGVREVAERLDLHENSVRFHLDRLVGDGLVEARPRAALGRGRPRLVYTAPARPDLGPERRRYRELAGLLADLVAARPDGVRSAADLGRTWGTALARNGPAHAPSAPAAVDELVEVLDEVGFAPEAQGPPDRPRILLRHCPFLEVAEDHPEIVCSIHRGLMDGVLAELGNPVGVERLVPFADPAGCVAHLGAAPTGAG